MVEADILTYLDPFIASTSGVDFFEGPMLDQPANCIAVAHYNSERSDDYTMGPSLTAPGYEIEDVQVMVRNTDMSTARSQAHAIYALLDNLQNTTINGRVYFHVEGDGPPFAIGMDDNERWRYVANYSCRKARG